MIGSIIILIILILINAFFASAEIAFISLNYLFSGSLVLPENKIKHRSISVAFLTPDSYSKFQNDNHLLLRRE